jgi:hypothetical protein
MAEEHSGRIVPVFKPARWLWLSALTGVLWLPLTFGSLALPFVGMSVAPVLAFAPVIYLFVFVNKAGMAKKAHGTPSSGSIWMLTILQLIIMLVSCFALINVIASFPGGRELLDIGGHIA